MSEMKEVTIEEMKDSLNDILGDPVVKTETAPTHGTYPWGEADISTNREFKKSPSPTACFLGGAVAGAVTYAIAEVVLKMIFKPKKKAEKTEVQEEPTEE